MIRLGVYATAIAAAAAAPQLQGVQSMDDQTMASYARDSINDNGVTLTARYAAVARDLQPGLRRCVPCCSM